MLVFILKKTNNTTKLKNKEQTPNNLKHSLFKANLTTFEACIILESLILATLLTQTPFQEDLWKQTERAAVFLNNGSLRKTQGMLMPCRKAGKWIMLDLFLSKLK